MAIWNHNSNFRMDELECLNEILKTGIPIENALNLLKSRENIDVVENMLLYLEKGTGIEEIIVHHIPKGLKLYLLPLMRLLPFSKALNLSLSFCKEEKESENFLLKNVSYPLILLFVSFTGLFLFDRFGMDSIVSMVRNFTEDVQGYAVIRVMIRILVTFFYLGLLVISGCVLYFSKPKRQFLFYSFIARRNDLIRSYFTSQLVRFVLLANRNGGSTKESLELVRSITERPILSALAFGLEDGMLEGKSLMEASENELLDPLFTKYLRISSASIDHRKILENYEAIVQKKMEKKLKNISLSVQLITYLFIGVIIVFIYQILFMPLQAISQF